MRAFNGISLLLVLSLNLNHIVFGIAERTSADRIESAGYSSESHSLLTEDGYTLTIFRIRNSTDSNNEKDNKSRPVVLLMHGLFCSSDIWLLARPEVNLAFNLFDSGYDVWLGNTRGTTYGSRHKFLSPKYPEFWQFTWHEIGVIDLPLTIDYILTETGQSSLHYVGHSQGTTVMFVLLSTLPEYRRKLRTQHMLAPIAYMKHSRFPMLKISAPIYGAFAPLGPLLADAALLYLPAALHILGFDHCLRPWANPEYCTSLLFFSIYGGYSAYFNRTLTREIFKMHPTRGSAHQPVHYAQLHVSGRFRQYDLGVEGNRQRYGRTTPPNYEVSNINLRFPFHFYYSDYDELSSKADVEHLSRLLGNRSVQHFIGLKHFSHLDFILATNVKNVINRQILETMNEGELLLRQNNSKYL